MDWQNYVEKVMKDYLVKHPDRKQFPTTRIIEKLRDLAIAEPDREFAKIWKWIDHNKFLVICPIIGFVIWLAAVSCQPETESPIRPGVFVNAQELATDFSVWELQQQQTMLKFEAGRQDIETQKAAWSEFRKLLLQLASGSVADLPGLLTLVMGFTGGGAILDNVRKRGLIAGLKRNKTPE